MIHFMMFPFEPRMLDMLATRGQPTVVALISLTRPTYTSTWAAQIRHGWLILRHRKRHGLCLRNQRDSLPAFNLDLIHSLTCFDAAACNQEQRESHWRLLDDGDSQGAGSNLRQNDSKLPRVVKSPSGVSLRNSAKSSRRPLEVSSKFLGEEESRRRISQGPQADHLCARGTGE